MRDIIFQELRNCNKTVAAMKDEAEREDGYILLFQTMDKIFELHNIARTEGLIALEEACSDIGDLQNSYFLKKLLSYVIDGWEPELIEEIGLASYFSSGVEGIEASQYLIMLIGALAIQRGENTSAIEALLTSLLPRKAEELYQKNKEEAMSTPEAIKERNEKRLREYYSGPVILPPEDDNYLKLKIADYAICALDNREIQRMLHDVNRDEMPLVLKGISGEARRLILENMSPQFAINMIDEIEALPPVRMSDIVNSVINIFDIIVRLINAGEICCSEKEVLLPVHKLFTEG